MIPIISNPEKLKRKSCEVPRDYLITHLYKSLQTAIREQKRGTLGMSAMQLGYYLNVFLMDYGTPTFFVNPVVKKVTGWTLSDSQEGCISVPNIEVWLYRPKEIKIQYHDENWNRRTAKFSGIEARIVCHEMDHLSGVLITDYVDSDNKAIKRALGEGVPLREPRGE